MESFFSDSIVNVMVVAGPIVTGIVQAVKALGTIKEKLIPFIAMGLGIATCGLLSGFTSDIIVAGIATGLMSSGLYSYAKTMTKKS